MLRRLCREIVLRDELFVSLIMAEVCHQRKFINFELLVFRGMEIIKSPLLEKDIFIDKVNKPAVLLVNILNYR